METRGIEPLSEKSSSRLSTSVSRLLKFPLPDAGAQASGSGIFFIYGRFKRKPAAHIYHCVTPATRPWCSVKGRSRTQAARATLLLLAFIFKLRLLERYRTSARLSRLRLPVETFTSPYQPIALPFDFSALSISRAARFFASSSRLS